MQDIGSTVAGQAWAYWSRARAPGEEHLDTEAGHDRSRPTARAAAANLAAAAGALRGNPIPPPPSD